MVTLEEAKRHVSTYAAEAELSKRRQRLNSLILLLECHLEDLQKRDKGDYYWSTLTASDLSVERIARESLFKWFESELLSGFEHDRRIKKLGYGFHGLCREVERRIRMLPTAPSPVMTTVAAPPPPPRPALPPSRIFERLRAGAAERFALRKKLIADGVPMASVEEQVSALYQRQKAAAEAAIRAEDEATAQERNRRLAEEIGAPVCLWGARTCGASAKRRWIRKRKGRGQKRPGRGGISPLRTTRRLRGPRRLWSPRSRRHLVLPPIVRRSPPLRRHPLDRWRRAPRRRTATSST
jgi:hypothetical protein